jgi:hypothetical protein
MARHCTICSHKDHHEIDRKIVGGILPITTIALEYSVGHMALRSHSRNHLSKTLVKTQEGKALFHSENMIQEVEDLVSKVKGILQQSEDNETHFVSLQAIKEMRNIFEFMAKVSVYLREQKKPFELSMQEQLEALENLSDSELDLYERLLMKIGGEGEPEEITDYGYKKSRFKRRKKLDYPGWQDDLEKTKTRKKVKFDFEDEKKETDETADGKGKD